MQGTADTDLFSDYRSTSDTWDASMETNIIYSRRFKQSSAQKWRFGYRFTINPDNRKYNIEELSTGLTSKSKTKGHLYTHNLQAFRRVNFCEKLFSFFTLNGNLRKGSSNSEYFDGTTTDRPEEYRYTQILGSLDWRTMWYLTKSNDLWLDFTHKLEYGKHPIKGRIA